jgi:hypothetical protein
MLEELVTIKLDKERHLRLTLKGMIEFEKTTGKNLLKGFNVNNFTLEDSGTLVWACLIHEDKELTIDDVLSMIDTGNLNVVMDAVTKCMGQSLPKSKAGDRPLAAKPQAG